MNVLRQWSSVNVLVVTILNHSTGNDFNKDLGMRSSNSTSLLPSLSTVGHRESSFDVVLSGVLPPPTLSHSSDLLAEVARLLRPSGSLWLQEPVSLQGQLAELGWCGR